jgi:E3 ubiquitin-protein ligase EDD1
MGLSVMHNDIFPITFTRPVLKFILGRKIAWHDLAFFDPDLFENLRKAVVAGATTPSTIESWTLCFTIDLPEWMGGGNIDLIPDGGSVPVTAANVRKYAELYAQHLMVEAIRPALVAIRAGILDVLPRSALNGLTAEDFRLLLNGCQEVDVEMLQRCVDFVDETGKGVATMETTKVWFWEVVLAMSVAEQHDLIYFWTSSPSLPATEAGLVPRPRVLVRPPSDGDAGLLPTANTCISRLSIPVYPSKEVLQQKLLLAITTKTFGFV